MREEYFFMIFILYFMSFRVGDVCNKLFIMEMLLLGRINCVRGVVNGRG